MSITPKSRLPHADRLLVILSDIEMGAGGLYDDFPHSDWLGELIATYSQAPYEGLPVDLIFNGDTFDLLKTAYLGGHPRHVTRDVAMGKMASIAAAHPLFFSAVRAFLAGGSEKAPRQVVFLEGNHDAELRFPEVHAFVRSLCGSPEQVHFPGLEHSVGRVQIEHGQQQDAMFRIDPEKPLIEYEGKQILNLAWGSAALLDTVIPMQPLLHFHDRLKPKNEVFDLLPDVKEYLVGSFWDYWTRDYWTGFWSTKDPTKKLTWTMLKEVVWRLGSKEVEVESEEDAQKLLAVEGDFDLYVRGHLHEARIRTHGHRKLVVAGCLRNEYMMLEEGKRLHPVPKSYVEVWLREGAPVVSNLVELEAPPAPAGYVPDSIFDVVPEVQRLLAEREAAKEHKEADAAMQAQEKKEAKEAKKAG
ncbi:MAG: hypothetical protein P1V51_11230 [Deltaproteobacteria bacterium]|nr:hypothetical protein [Deltaproteobacteria bacterium]